MILRKYVIECDGCHTIANIISDTAEEAASRMEDADFHYDVDGKGNMTTVCSFCKDPGNLAGTE